MYVSNVKPLIVSIFFQCFTMSMTNRKTMHNDLITVLGWEIWQTGSLTYFNSLNRGEGFSNWADLHFIASWSIASVTSIDKSLSLWRCSHSNERRKVSTAYSMFCIIVIGFEKLSHKAFAALEVRLMLEPSQIQTSGSVYNNSNWSCETSTMLSSS